MPRTLTKKRTVGILKDREEFQNRLTMRTWDEPTADWQLRLGMLLTFRPNQTVRQNVNHARLVLKA